MAEKKTPEESRNHFAELYAVNVNGRTEQKNGLTYLSWAWAYAEFLKVYPDAVYEIVKFDGIPYAYDPRTGYMVYTRITAGGITREMWLPVMDGANKAMKAEPYEYTVKNPNHKYATKQPDGTWLDRYGNEQPEFLTKTCEAASMFDVNKTIMRCLVKNLAMFGLGLYIYAGEDLPEEEAAEAKQAAAKQEPKAPAKQTAKKQEPKQEPKKAPVAAEEPEATEANGSKRKQARQTDPITAEMASALIERCKKDGVDVVKLCSVYKVKAIPQLSLGHLQNMNQFWDQVKERCAKYEEG